MKRALMLLAMVLLPLAAGAQAVRSEAEIETMARQLSAELRCPVCQGLSLKDSPTELSMEMKSVILQQLREGRSVDEVKDYFVDRYGEWILLEPRRTGFNWFVYVVPWIALGLGLAVVVMLVRRWTRVEPSPLAEAGVTPEGWPES